MQAWVAYVNGKGGLNCHPVKYFIVDDGGDPSRNQALTEQLVEQDHVLAFVAMDAALAGQASESYLMSKRVPVVGTDLASPWAYTSPMYFMQASSAPEFSAVLLSAAVRSAGPGNKAILGTLVCIESTNCSNIGSYVAHNASKFGGTLVYQGTASITQPDYTANCQAAQRAGAQIIIFGMDGNSLERVARSCNSVNYHPRYVLGGPEANLSEAADPYLDGAINATTVLPWMMTSNPQIVEYQNVLKQYAPGLVPDAASIDGWVAAKLFELVTRNLSEPPTSQGILGGLWSVKDNDLGGLTKPLTFTTNQVSPDSPTCYWVTKIQGGQFISPDGGARTCF